MCSEIYVATVHQSSIQIMVLDMDGIVLKQNQVQLEDLLEKQLTETQVSCYLSFLLFYSYICHTFVGSNEIGEINNNFRSRDTRTG